MSYLRAIRRNIIRRDAGCKNLRSVWKTYKAIQRKIKRKSKT